MSAGPAETTAAGRGMMLGASALVGTAVLWGSNHVVARGSTEIVPFAAFLFWRWAAALPLLGLAALPALRREAAFIRAHLASLAWLGAMGVGVFSVCLIGGAYHSLAIEVSIINTTTPAWVALITLAATRRTPGAAMLAGLALALGGAVLILTRGDPADLFRIEARLGNLYALTGAIIFAWFTIRLRPFRTRMEALSLTFVTAAAGVVLVLLPFYLASGLMLGRPWLAFRADEAEIALAILAFAALGPGLIGNSLYIYGLSALGPQRAAAFLYLMPIASSILAVIFLGEAFAWYHAAGFALVVAGLLLVNRGPSP